MRLLTPGLLQRVQTDIVAPLAAGLIEQAVESIEQVLVELYSSIPENKRISYGRVYTIKLLARELFNLLESTPSGAFPPQVRGTALGIHSHCGLKDYAPTLPYFESAAASDTWELRELAQMFFRRLIGAFPEETKAFLIDLGDRSDPNLRRFVAETLRPDVYRYKDRVYCRQGTRK